MQLAWIIPQLSSTFISELAAVNISCFANYTSQLDRNRSDDLAIRERQFDVRATISPAGIAADAIARARS